MSLRLLEKIRAELSTELSSKHAVTPLLHGLTIQAHGITRSTLDQAWYVPGVRGRVFSLDTRCCQAQGTAGFKIGYRITCDEVVPELEAEQVGELAYF